MDSNAKDGVKKKPKKSISMEMKHEIIKKHERGVKICKLAAEYDRNASTISTIIKQKEAIKKVQPSTGLRVMSALRSSFHNEMEHLLLIWIKEKELAGDSISENIISRKAVAIFNELKLRAAEVEGDPLQIITEEFKASRGWFENFKKRTGLHSGVSTNIFF